MTREPGPAAEAVISQWAAGESRTRQLAAALALELALRPDHTRLEAGTATAARCGVSRTTAVNARNLLIGAGLLYKHGPHYYKAPTRNGTGR